MTDVSPNGGSEEIDPVSPANQQSSPALRTRIYRGFALAWRWCVRGIKLLAIGTVAALAVMSGFIILTNAFIVQPRNIAYRATDPDDSICDPNGPGWTILAEKNNDEYAVASDPTWRKKLSCAVQTHVIPANQHNKEVRYRLAFVEFDEKGAPFLLRKTSTSSGSQGQIEAVERYLAGGSNYVIAFVHGWRHDASIGDSNIADLRIYAAAAARALKDRCDAGRHEMCGTRVTAIYVGWPGARVSEAHFAHWPVLESFGEHLGALAAIPTLFDRKPISESVAPSSFSALADISQALKSRPKDSGLQKMIVFGHSLGGNLLLTALRDYLVKAVDLHQPGTIMTSPIGDLVVLINPASEASNWTAIQRAVWKRIPFAEDEGGNADQIAKGHSFFNVAQRPILVSVTASRSWPTGGFRPIDCQFTNPPITRRSRLELLKELESLKANESRIFFGSPFNYDWATYDLFPAFRGDLRPVSDSLARYGYSLAGEPNQDEPCASKAEEDAANDNREKSPLYDQALGRLLAWIGGQLAYLPFMNTDIEYTRTLGHLDPPRPAVGSVVDTRRSRRMFGTTHLLMGRPADFAPGAKPPDTAPYQTIDAAPSCPVANNWLLSARQARQVAPSGTFWDSEEATAPGGADNKPALRFIHGLGPTAGAPITRANDPFWNMRAFDDVLASHGGYLFPGFICAMNQLVLDDVTPSVSTLPTAEASCPSPQPKPQPTTCAPPPPSP